MNAPCNPPKTARAKGKSLDAAADQLRLQALEDMSELAASLWTSIREAAYRGEPTVIALHCHQVRVVTRESFALVRSLGAPTARDGAA